MGHLSISPWQITKLFLLIADGSDAAERDKTGLVKFPRSEDAKSRQFFGNNHVHVDTTAHNHAGGLLPHRHAGGIYDDDYYGGGYGGGRYYGSGGYYGSSGGLYGLRYETYLFCVGD